MSEQTENEQQKTKKTKTPEDKKKTGKRVLTIVLSVLVSVGVFFAGFFTDRLTLDDGMRTLIAVKDKIQKEYYKEITDEEFYRVLFDAVNDDLLDPYSYYMTADEYADTMTAAQGSQSGIGLNFYSVTPEGVSENFVLRVNGNSPSERAGILDGDIITGFGVSEETLTESESREKLFTFIQERKTGESFVLRLRRGETVKTVTLAKSAYKENYVFYRTNETAFRFTGNDALTLTEGGEALRALPTDTAYIRLTHFNGGSAEQFALAMQRFKTDNKKNLVLDLRGNGGGYMDILQEIARYFCKGAKNAEPLIVVADYGEKKESFYAKGNNYGEYFSADSRICVLADSMTASASEALIGCMVDYGATAFSDICLSERNGTAKTYGKGIMQTTFPFGLINTDAIKLTTATLRWPTSGKCIHDHGVLPDDGALTVAENYERDGEINAALAVLFP